MLCDKKKEKTTFQMKIIEEARLPVASCEKKKTPLPWGICTQQMNVSFKCHHSSVTHWGSSLHRGCGRRKAQRETVAGPLWSHTPDTSASLGPLCLQACPMYLCTLNRTHCSTLRHRRKINRSGFKLLVRRLSSFSSFLLLHFLLHLHSYALLHFLCFSCPV